MFSSPGYTEYASSVSEANTWCEVLSPMQSWSQLGLDFQERTACVVVLVD